MAVLDLTDAHQFAVDLHVPDRRFSFLPVTDELIDRSPFLDTRLEVPFQRATHVLAAKIPAQLPQARIAWLFHTSFCASTLLARALHLPPYTVALKEPLVLRRLSDARKSNWSLDPVLPATVRLLARPWHPEGAIVIKPTHVALNIAATLMAATPDSKAVILSSTLDDFLLSNLKKTAESQDKIPLLVERTLKATQFGTWLSTAALQPPDLICAAGLQWAAQRELMVDVVAAVGPQRVRTLAMGHLLADVAGCALQCAEWLQLPLPSSLLARHARDTATRHAKSPDMAFSPEHRAHESAQVLAHYRDQLGNARAWLDAHVLPVMRPQARQDAT